MTAISKETFDRHLEGILASDGCPDLLKGLHSKYVLAKQRAATEVLSWIPKVEPNLSDHGILHIENVIENAARLLGLDPGYNANVSGQTGKPFGTNDLSPVEAYVLAMSLLFHDCGNIRGRRGHAQAAGEVMGSVMAGVLRADEILLIGKIMAAHSGKASNGTNDKIGELDTRAYLHKEPVRAQQVAALLRFADELAEGPQRTSNLLRNDGAFRLDSNSNSPESEEVAIRNPFHDFAASTEVIIDPGHGRVALTFIIDLDDQMFSLKPRERLKALLEMIFFRIRKTDEERRYARHYGGKLLLAFHTTQVAITFVRGGQEIDPNLSPLVINDLVIPGFDPTGVSHSVWVKHYNQKYDAEALCAELLDD
jgi:hypothetical protein